MIPCQTPAELKRFLNRQADAAERAEIERHLASCPTCSSVLEQVRAPARETLGLTVDQPPREPVPASVLARIKRAGPEEEISSAMHDATRSSGLPVVPGYTNLAEIGHGGMGIVYRATQKRTNRLVALKMITDKTILTEQTVERFRNEAVSLGRLNHPGIVQIHEVIATERGHFICLEFCDGGSLAERLGKTTLPADTAARLVEKLALAIHAAHRKGIVHRDLKPDNVFLLTDPQCAEPIGSDSTDDLWRFIPKIGDFGLAKSIHSDAKLTTHGAIMGTPSYMAPEQASGEGDQAGPAADIYALGAILYECLTGRPPFTGANALETIEQVRTREPVPVRSLNPKVARDLETICLKCLQKEPAKRYATAKLLADDLNAFLAGKPIEARPVGAIEKAIKWTKRRPAVAALIASLALVAIVGTVLVTWKWREAVANADAQRIAREDADWNAAAERIARGEADSQRGRAENQTKLATGRLTQLRDVSEKLLFDFDDDVSRLPGSTPVRKKFVVTALAQFNLLRREVGDDPNLLHFLAVAYCKVGDVQGNPDLPNLNDLAGAMASYELALGVADAAQRIQPDDRVARRDRMIVLGKIGAVREGRGDATGAYAKYLESLRLAEEMATATPSNVQTRRDVAIGHERIGRALAALGRSSEAAESLDRALKEYQKLAAGNPEAKRDLAVAYLHVGIIQADLGLMKEALTSYRKQLDLLEELSLADPDDVAGIRDRLVAHNNIGDALARMGDANGAQEHYAKSKQFADQLGKADSGNAQAQRDRAIGLERIGETHAVSGRTGDALKAFTESERLRVALAEGDPENPLLQRELSTALEKVGDQLLALNKRADAEKKYQRSLIIRKNLVTRSPDDVENQRLVAVAYKKLGAFYLQTGGSPKLARQHILEALRIRRAMCLRDPRHMGNQRQLAMSLEDAGDAEQQLLRRDEAGAYYREAIAVARQASKIDPANNWALDTLAGTLERYGKWLSDHRGLDDPFTFVGSSLAAVAWERDRADRAYAHLGECLAIWEKLAQDKSDLHSQRGLMVALQKVGLWLKDEDRFNDALSRFQQRHNLCLAIEKARQDSGSRRDLATSFEHLGSTHQKLGEAIGDVASRFVAIRRAIGFGPWSAAANCAGAAADGQLDQALKNLSQSRKIRKQLLDGDPTNPVFAQELATIFEHAGHAFRTLRNRKQTLACFDDACKLRDRVVEQLGWENPTAHRLRALTYYWRADAHAFFGDEARQALDERVADWRDARLWYSRSQGVYVEMKKRDVLPPEDRHMIDNLTRIIAVCDQAIAHLTARQTRQ